MKGGKRALSSWNMFVKKVYREGKSKNSNYAFKDALKDASRRKREMGHESHSGMTHKVKKSKRRHTRKHRSHRRH
jgi:hypothetical protein